MKNLVRPVLLLLLVGLAVAAHAQSTVPSPRIYIFDNGGISGLDPALFNFSAAELAEVDFVEKPEGIIDTASFSALRNAKTMILDNADHDVFGDGSVVIMATPGHTPGHQVVAVELENAGTILLGGDLYHYPEERTTGRVPTFEYDAATSRASRARVEAFLRDSQGTLWIEHDLATHAALPKSPGYVD